MKTKAYYETLIELLSKQENILNTRRKLEQQLQAMPDRTTKMFFHQQVFSQIKALNELDLQLKDYPSDEVYLMKNCVWKYEEKRLKDSVKTVYGDFKKRDYSEKEEVRKERLDTALCFLLGYLFVKGRFNEAMLVSLGGEFGIGLAIGMMLNNGLFDNQRNTTHN